ncbi:hypothetical protein T484DRAFT_2803145, partial [Baffinella frigidus]
MRDESKWILFVVSCACFAGLVRQLAGPVKRKALKAGTLQLYSSLVWFILVVWTCYPLVFLLSHEGLGVLTTDQEVVMFTILDIIAKAGFTFLYLYLRRQAKPHPEAWPLSPVQAPGSMVQASAEPNEQRRKASSAVNTPIRADHNLTIRSSPIRAEETRAGGTGG